MTDTMQQITQAETNRLVATEAGQLPDVIRYDVGIITAQPSYANLNL